MITVTTHSACPSTHDSLVFQRKINIPCWNDATILRGWPQFDSNTCRCSAKKFNFKSPSKTGQYNRRLCLRAFSLAWSDALSPSRICLPILESKTCFEVVQVKSAEEKLAAATLRAQIFYPYPENQLENMSNFAEQESVVTFPTTENLLTERIRSEFFRDYKLDFLGMKVTCFLAVCLESEYKHFIETNPGENNVTILTKGFNPPVIGTNEEGECLVALGTMDVQVGNSLPGENLEGKFPRGGDPSVERGYIFNLCVHPSFRRVGVARNLMETGAEFARDIGVRVLYCHVEANNVSAQRLYTSLGYVVEQEETEDWVSESGRCKPRRRLLKIQIDCWD